MYQSNPELMKLQQEQATVEQQLKQLQHKQQRLENRKAYYEKAEGDRTLLQCKRPHCGDLHPRYEAETAADGIRRKISTALPANRG